MKNVTFIVLDKSSDNCLEKRYLFFTVSVGTTKDRKGIEKMSVLFFRNNLSNSFNLYSIVVLMKLYMSCF